MTVRVSALLALGGVALLTSCSTAPVQETHSPKAAQDLANALAGRVAGPPLRCISQVQARNMHVIDDWTILFRNGRTVYVQNPRGGCTGLGRGDMTLVRRQFGTTQLCDGDINRVVDLRSNFGTGACVYGPFVPYTKPKS